MRNSHTFIRRESLSHSTFSYAVSLTHSLTTYFTCVFSSSPFFHLPFQMEGYSNSDVGCDEESVLVTPYQKQVLLKSDLQPRSIDLPLSSGGDNSSVTSMKEDCESPLSSWESEPEFDIPSVINCHGMLEGPNELNENCDNMEQQDQFVGVENTDDSLLWEIDNRSYDELLVKFIHSEQELRVANFKLQLSEQEIIKLNVQIEKGEDQLDDVREELKLKEEELHKQKELSEEEIFKLKIQIEKSEGQLDNVREELKLKDEELYIRKELSEEQIFMLSIQIEKSEDQLDKMREELKLKGEELQKQTAELETHIPDYVCRIAKLVDDLEIANEQLKISKDEIEVSRKELDNKSSETHQLEDQLKVAQKNMANLESELVEEEKQIQMLEELVKWYEANETNRNLEVKKLTDKILVSEAKFASERDTLYSDIESLSDMKMNLNSKLKDSGSRNIELENKLRKCEAEKMEQEKLHESQQIVLQDDIRSLREELNQRRNDVEAVNKKFVMLMTERDEANAKIDKLNAEICSRDDQITSLMEVIHKLKTLQKELVTRYKTIVGELQKEVTRQNGVISERNEEKREAIRQLCFSLEHYRSGYIQLLQAFIGQRRRGGDRARFSCI
ncbi:uncharacterized protein [Cicer arietinum]|uniref:Protein NETWORKED 4B-like n=1 Tax=Cicer arietinum TaxID=3827 RepID=A0A1S3E960_CICAR|nr:protein NETWORKED 4B-like [Cicer arietinum]